jgi:hypothetical protein
MEHQVCGVYHPRWAVVTRVFRMLAIEPFSCLCVVDGKKRDHIAAQPPLCAAAGCVNGKHGGSDAPQVQLPVTVALALGRIGPA